MADSTHDALRAHMSKWREGKGFNANPLADLGEQIRWLCARIDNPPPVEVASYPLAKKWRGKFNARKASPLKGVVDGK